jgi:hypothetical protein
VSRDGDPQQQAQRTIDLIAHAFSPVAWKWRSLVIAIVLFAAVATVTVVQRALISDSVMGWTFTAVHGAIALVGVPVLSIRAVREWRAARADQPSGVPE